MQISCIPFSTRECRKLIELNTKVSLGLPSMLKPTGLKSRMTA